MVISLVRSVAIRGRLMVMAAVLLAVMAGFGAVSFTQISQAKAQSLTLDRVSDIQATSLELHADVAALSAAQRE